TEIKLVVPERSRGKDLGTESDFLHRMAVLEAAEQIPIQHVKRPVLAATHDQVRRRASGRQVGEDRGAAGSKISVSQVVICLIRGREPSRDAERGGQLEQRIPIVV